MLKECCVGSYLAAKEAYVNEVDRIGLCDNLAEGGTGIVNLSTLDD